MSSKIVVASYISETVFKIPKNIDLENQQQVKDWWIKWNVLHIELVDGTELQIEQYGGYRYPDYKYPHEKNIENASDWCISDSEDEKEENEEEYEEEENEEENEEEEK